MLSTTEAKTASKAAKQSGGCRVRAVHRGELQSNFNVGRNELLLLSALGRGIDYPHNCRVGVCGSCKTKLISGKIRPMIDFALSPLTNAELEAGYILACQSKVHSDLEIEVKIGNHTPPPVQTVASHVVGWRQLPGEVVDLRLRLDEPLPFEAGQYCSLAESGSFVRRSYSIYDPPPGEEGATELGFMVKRLPGGAFSEWLFNEDRVGTKIWIEGPFGVMGVHDDDLDRDGLCVAGGTGLAPVLSIVADRLARSDKARFTILFGARTQADRFAEPWLEALVAQAPDRVRVVTILSDEPADSDWEGPRGLITEPLQVGDLGIDFGTTAAFVCGALPMVQAVEALLIERGVNPDRIHADKFLPTG